MDFADLIDVGKTMEEFRKEWLLRYTPNDVKFWAPRLESDIPAEQICASMLLEAWGCHEVFAEYKKWLELKASSQKLRDKYYKHRNPGGYSYSLARRDYEWSQFTWPEYLQRDKTVSVIDDFYY